jgi:hypothetical protein
MKTDIKKSNHPLRQTGTEREEGKNTYKHIVRHKITLRPTQRQANIQTTQRTQNPKKTGIETSKHPDRQRGIEKERQKYLLTHSQTQNNTWTDIAIYKYPLRYTSTEREV